LPVDQAERLTKLVEPETGHGPFRARTHAEITALLDGLAVQPPGLVSVVEWRPERGPQPHATPAQAVAYGAVLQLP
jgi:hypothetical protein